MEIAIAIVALILLCILTCPELFCEVQLLALGQVHKQLPKLKKKITQEFKDFCFLFQRFTAVFFLMHCLVIHLIWNKI